MRAAGYRVPVAEGYRKMEGLEEIRKEDSPLNSNRRRDKALIEALIICGVAAVKPAATIVIYSSALAWTVSDSQDHTSEASLSDSSGSKPQKQVAKGQTLLTNAILFFTLYSDCSSNTTPLSHFITHDYK